MSDNNKAAPGRWTWEFITPETAQKYLNRMIRNRPPIRNHITWMAYAISAGEFDVTHQGIAINSDGELYDGQNRMHAIIKADRGIWLWVFRASKPVSVLNIDTHKKRSDADAVYISGIDINRSNMAMLRMLMAGSKVDSRKLQRSDIAEAAKRHREAIAWVSSRIPHAKGVSHACVTGIIARAWYSADRDRLAEFTDALRTGHVSNIKTDTAATKLRDFMLTSKITSGGAVARSHVAAKVEAALVAFLEYRPLTVLREISEEAFPLPEDAANAN